MDDEMFCSWADHETSNRGSLQRLQPCPRLHEHAALTESLVDARLQDPKILAPCLVVELLKQALVGQWQRPQLPGTSPLTGGSGNAALGKRVQTVLLNDVAAKPLHDPFEEEADALVTMLRAATQPESCGGLERRASTSPKERMASGLVDKSSSSSNASRERWP